MIALKFLKSQWSRVERVLLFINSSIMSYFDNVFSKVPIKSVAVKAFVGLLVAFIVMFLIVVIIITSPIWLYLERE